MRVVDSCTKYYRIDMLGLNRRQVYRIARRKGLLFGLGSQRGNASAHSEMVIKSPREVSVDAELAEGH